jgi:RNA exonuclease 4
MSNAKRPICRFYASGNCRNGDQCPFSHELDISVTSSSDAPNSVIINLPLGHPVYGIDVECVASGISHNARSIAQVALVDEYCRPAFNAYIKQDIPVLSYITELTGLTKEIIDTHGLPLGDFLKI